MLDTPEHIWTTMTSYLTSLSAAIPGYIAYLHVAVPQMFPYASPLDWAASLLNWYLG